MPQTSLSSNAVAGVFPVSLTIASLALALGAAELLLRAKNSSMKTYDIEMWRILFLGGSIAPFAMPGDPHPNAPGHQLMADAIPPSLHK